MSRSPTPPEKVGKILAEAETVEESIRAIAEREGVTATLVDSLIQNIKRNHPGFFEKSKELANLGIAELMEHRMHEALAHMTTRKMEEASIRDLATTVGILNQNALLRKGQPTQIISTAARENMNELLPELAKEMANRNMTVDLTPQDYSEVEGTAARVDYEMKPKNMAERGLRYHKDRRRRSTLALAPIKQIDGTQGEV